MTIRTDILADGLATIAMPGWPILKMVRCQSRKWFSCHHCGLTIEPRSPVWRPITNGNHRPMRICPRCIAGGLPAAKTQE